MFKKLSYLPREISWWKNNASATATSISERGLNMEGWVSRTSFWNLFIIEISNMGSFPTLLRLCIYFFLYTKITRLYVQCLHDLLPISIRVTKWQLGSIPVNIFHKYDKSLLIGNFLYCLMQHTNITVFIQSVALYHYYNDCIQYFLKYT